MTNPVIYTNGYIYHNGQFIKGGFETENGIFTRIFDRDTQPESIGAKTVDLQGAYVIPGLIDIHVQATGQLTSSNADIMLDSTLESEEALKAYAVHPAHVAVANGIVRPNTELRTCLDFEL